MTCWISLKSRPLEATPEATMTSLAPDLKDRMAYSRSSWAAGCKFKQGKESEGVMSTKN
jgi:hypothetical protein